MNVIVTGASKGIGAGIATFLAMDGYNVGLMARSKDLLEDVRQSIEEEGGTCSSAACDVCDADQVSYAVAALADRLGGIDALINNAGLVIRKDIFEISTGEWHAMINTNVNGAFNVTRAVLPYFQEKGEGRIINISSISGKVPLPGGSGYAASKYALTGLSQSLFHELRDHGITVTAVYPGSVDSASHRHDPGADHSWKVQPEEVGQACRDVLRMRPGCAISELEIRPLARPPKT